jgi:hypothetical protein
MEKNRMLFETTFNRKLTDADAVSFLEKLTAEHPYFSAAQFYLLQLCSKDRLAYKKQAQKTSALFNNNYWLNFQLIDAGINNETAAEEEKIDAVIDSVSANSIAVPELSASPAKEVSEEIENPLTTTDFAEETSSIEATPEEPVSIEANALAIVEPIEEQPEPLVEAPEIEITTSIDTVAEPITAAAIVEIEEHEEGITPTVTAEDTITPSAVEEPAQLAPLAAAKENIEEKHETATEEMPPMITAAITEAKEMNLAPIIPAINSEANANDLLFEPLHTSDYFASVGIKLSEDEKTQDKLGKQLKSFTDWLKTMKRTHAEQLSQVSKSANLEAAGADGSIQKLAEKSNKENDIVTEAMAEVLFQQGRQDKGIEILEKLSLLNPTKSAYFAAKINQIKEK